MHIYLNSLGLYPLSIDGHYSKIDDSDFNYFKEFRIKCRTVPDMTHLSNKKIKRLANELFCLLNKIPLNQKTLPSISSELKEVTKQNKKFRHEFADKLYDLYNNTKNIEDKKLVNTLFNNTI